MEKCKIKERELVMLTCQLFELHIPFYFLIRSYHLSRFIHIYRLSLYVCLSRLSRVVR